MALKDIVSTVLTRYKADISDQKRKIKQLSGEQQKAAKAQLAEMERQNAAIDKQIGMWTKVAIGVGSAVAAYATLAAGADQLQKRNRLMSANMGTDLNSLKKATSGLISEMDLLEFSAAAMTGTFKLTQEQTELVLKGALALRKTMGIDLKTAMDRVKQAVTEANTEALKPLGIHIVEATGSMEAQEKIVTALSERYGALKGNVEIAGDELTRQQVDMRNATDDLKEAFGRMALALTPLIRKMAEFVELTVGFLSHVLGDDVQKKADKQLGVNTFNFVESAGTNRAAQALDDMARERGAIVLPKGVSQKQALKFMVQVGDTLTGILGEEDVPQEIKSSVESANKAMEKAKSKVKAGSFGGSLLLGGKFIDRREGEFLSRTESELFAGAGAGAGALSGAGASDLQAFGDSALGGAAGIDLGSINADLEKTIANIEAMQAISEANQKAKRSMLASIFGTPAEMNETKAGFELMATGFDAFAGAAGSSIEALITGSKGMKEAFRDFLGDALLSMAVEMGVRAIRETAFGTAALFIPGMQATAANHFKAAAVFTAGAAAAGVGARALGVGGSPSVSSGAIPAAAGAGSSGAGQASGRQTQVIVLGDNFDDMSPRERESRARRMLRRAHVELEGDAVTRS